MSHQNQFNQPIGYPVNNWQPRQLPSLTPMQGQYCLLEPFDMATHAELLFEAFQFNNAGETWTYLPFGPFDTFAN